MFDFFKSLLKANDEDKIALLNQKPEKDKQIVRKMVIFTGKVQGVGFRFEAYSVAAKLGLTGYVKNRQDLSVLLEVQGDKSLVFNFVEYLSNLPRVRVDNIEIIDMKVKNYEMDFEIQR